MVDIKIAPPLVTIGFDGEPLILSADLCQAVGAIYQALSNQSREDGELFLRGMQIGINELVPAMKPIETMVTVVIPKENG